MISKVRAKAMSGNTKTAFIAMGTPHVSAIVPSKVTPMPPALMVKPTIIPDAIPKCWGRRTWAMTVVRAKVEIKTIPANPRRMKDMRPLL